MKKAVAQKIEADRQGLPMWGSGTTAIGYPHTFATYTTNATPAANRYTAMEILSNASNSGTLLIK